jgi:hypothetical protein
MNSLEREAFLEFLLQRAGTRRKILYKGNPETSTKVSLFVAVQSRPGSPVPLGEVDFRFFQRLQKVGNTMVSIDQFNDIREDLSSLAYV